MMAFLLQYMPHLIVAPILLPLFSAALMLLFGEKRRLPKALANILACLLGLLVACTLMVWSKSGEPSAYGVYLMANWQAPFGITLVLDRLSALMLVLSSSVGLAAALFAAARWHRAGVHFNVLMQLQIMGINGIVLTGDLFNLYVFFEIMLAASYGLLLHGSGPSRVRAGLHYVAVNLLASAFFLVGAALIYGVTGTLNMADLAVRIPQVALADQPLLHAGLAILFVAFFTKAAIWPLNFWLIPAYTAASTPVEAIFVILTKVGFYVLLRLSSLFFAPTAGAAAEFGSNLLICGGMLTIAFGSFGMLAAQRLAKLAACAVLVSAGTLMAMLGFGGVPLVSAALYYLSVSTLGVSAFYLLTELVERSRNPDPEAQLAPEDEEDRLPFPLAELDFVEGVNLDEKEEALIGEVIPAAIAFMGMAFIICTLLIAGLPPLAGFVGKFAMLSALINPDGMPDAVLLPRPAAWALLALIIISGLLAMIAMSRTGIRFFWAPKGRAVPRLGVIECLPIVVLLGLCIALTVYTEAAMRYTRNTANALYDPALYINAVLQAAPVDADTLRGNVETLP